MSADVRQSDEWDVDALDLDAYLARIGHRAGPATVATLWSLHAAHVRTMPFENVDVLIGTHPGLALRAIADKLVGRERGGYCYEHGLLFAAALERLGFPVQRRISRVQPDRSGPRTHMTLVVGAEGEDYLADIGFGAGLLHPMLLRDGIVADQAGWSHRLTRRDGLWFLDRRAEDGWSTLHAFDDSVQRPIDYEVAHHYTATHPGSPFTGRLIVMRLEEGRSRRLVGDELTVETPDGQVERTTIPPARLAATLGELDVRLDDAELDAVLARYPAAG